MPLKLVSLPSLEEFEAQGTSGLWFLFEEGWEQQQQSPTGDDIKEIVALISWLVYLKTEEQVEVLKANPWITECLSYEPRLVSSLGWKRAGQVVSLKASLDSLKLIATKLKVAGKLP